MTKIDDEMVDRAVSAFLLAYEERTIEHAMRVGLEAALSPKPEPEIEVTEIMEDAGLHAYWAGEITGLRYSGWNERARKQIANVYRAMRALEPKTQEGAAYAAKDARQGVSSGAPVKETGGGVQSYWSDPRTFRTHLRSTDDSRFTFAKPHRRKDDPT